MIISDKILEEAREHIKKLMDNKLSDDIVFHNYNHAMYVEKAAKYIGQNCGLNEEELKLVELSAIFHDVGFIVNREDHEKESVKIATKFLINHGFSDEIITPVSNAILSTSIPQLPKDNISKVLCDADLMHLADPDYINLIEGLRKEWRNTSQEKLSKRKFYSMSLTFFNKHNYNTNFAIKEFTKRKLENLESLKKELLMLDKKKEKDVINKAKKKSSSYSRGVESMFRLTARNQMSLSSIADNKSNILITVNSLILSILLTVVVSKFEETPNIILPSLIFISFSLITIVLAILSTRPNISSGKFTKEDIKQNKVNLLFFGNFYNMSLDEYEWAIGELMRNDENLYNTMIKDQYSLGKVLAKKYKLLRVAYSVFMFGIIISAIAFVISFINI
jgi:predicted metal-dependent HD superfamily phosphohydrolase